MPSQTDQAAETARLAILVQRLLDADLLTPEQAEALVDEAEAAGRFSEMGDLDSTRHHVERIAQITQALVGCGALDVADGLAVINSLRLILRTEADDSGGTNRTDPSISHASQT